MSFKQLNILTVCATVTETRMLTALLRLSTGQRKIQQELKPHLRLLRLTKMEWPDLLSHLKVEKGGGGAEEDIKQWFSCPRDGRHKMSPGTPIGHCLGSVQVIGQKGGTEAEPSRRPGKRRQSQKSGGAQSTWNPQAEYEEDDEG